MRKFSLRLATGVAILVAGCAAHDDGDTTATTTTSAAQQPAPVTAEPTGSAPPVAFVRLRPQSGACSGLPSLDCDGGYSASAVNGQDPGRVVTWFDLSKLPRSAVAQSAGDPQEVILRGTFGPPDAASGGAPLTVLDAWRGLPGLGIPATDPVYAVATVDGRMIAGLLNSDRKLPIDAISFSALDAPLVDPAWLTGRVLAHGALVIGRITGTTLEAGQVLVHLPDVVGPCPVIRLACGNETATYERDQNRCDIPTGCASPHVCPQFRPRCEPGYDLVSWPSQPDGCLAFACEPTFLRFW